MVILSPLTPMRIWAHTVTLGRFLPLEEPLSPHLYNGAMGLHHPGLAKQPAETAFTSILPDPRMHSPSPLPFPLGGSGEPWRVSGERALTIPKKSFLPTMSQSQSSTRSGAGAPGISRSSSTSFQWGKRVFLMVWGKGRGGRES